MKENIISVLLFLKFIATLFVLYYAIELFIAMRVRNEIFKKWKNSLKKDDVGNGS